MQQGGELGKNSFALSALALLQVPKAGLKQK